MKPAVENLYKRIEKNWLNIILISFLFNASKKIIFNFMYIRGIPIDYFLPKLNINTLFLFFLSLFFIQNLRYYKGNFRYIFYILFFLIVNVLFSINTVNSFYYFLYLISVFFIFMITLSMNNLQFEYKWLNLLNFFYIVIFLLQYFFQNSLLPYFPFGTYYFNTLNTHLDYSSLFGLKMLIPAVNFPHPNVLCAFLSFLNIFHLRKKNYLFFVLNFFVILLCSSFASILFNLGLVYYQIWKKYNHTKLRFFLFSFTLSLVSIICLSLFFDFGFKPVSISERIFQFNIFRYSIEHFQLFGTGANNFIFVINMYESIKGRVFVLQPIHNVFLLLLSEYGFTFLIPVFLIVKKFRFFLKPSIFLFYLVFFSLFDHFFITINQGLLLVLLTIYMHKSIIIDNAP